VQVSDSIDGKTFKSTPQFNVSLLRDTPPELGMQWGDWRDTTYVGANAPLFNDQHILVRTRHGRHRLYCTVCSKFRLP
jgi:hypothetical protein